MLSTPNTGVYSLKPPSLQFYEATRITWPLNKVTYFHIKAEKKSAVTTLNLSDMNKFIQNWFFFHNWETDFRF